MDDPKELTDALGYLADGRRAVHRIEETLPKQLRRLTPRGTKDASSAYQLRALLAYRMHSVSRASAELFQERDSIPGLVLSRAALETAVVLAYLHSAIEDFLAGSRDDDSYSEFSELVLNTTLATRRPEWDKRFEAKNILTLVDRLEKRRPGFRTEYEWLCEYTHPNLSGVLGSFGSCTDADGFRLGEFDQTGFVFGVCSLNRSLRLFEELYAVQGLLLEEVDDDLVGRPSVAFTY